jgi:hypothetical protein
LKFFIDIERQLDFRQGKIFSYFSHRPGQLWGASILLINGHRRYSSGIKRLGLNVDHPSPFITELYKQVELHHHFHTPTQRGNELKI